MLFHYKAIDSAGTKREGNIDAINTEVAISALQRRGLIISTIVEADKKSLLKRDITLFERVTYKELVILSRQIATLFEAQVSALRIFKLLGAESENSLLRKKLSEVTDDLQGGSSISNALSKHDDVFSSFYINMVRAGEESGKLDQTFLYLADYLDRNYEITTKARNALFYPAFVIATFIGVMVLMLTLVIPKLAETLLESGADIPIYTTVVIAVSTILTDYWLFALVGIVAVLFILIRYARTEEGGFVLSDLKLKIPYVGSLFEKLYLSRIADNFHTMLESGIPMVRTIELTAKVVDNRIYEDMLTEAAEDVRGGMPLSGALGKHDRMPGIMVQMIKVGEETGEVGNILNTLSVFYRREVNNAVDTLVELIEPVMVVFLGTGVGILLASILIPIYNIAGSF